MKVQFIGSQGDPDEITMFGYTFERKGEPVEVPDNHKHAEKFINNQHFKVQQTAKVLPAPKEPDAPDDDQEPAPRAPRTPKAKPGPKAKPVKDAPTEKAGEEPANV